MSVPVWVLLWLGAQPSLHASSCAGQASVAHRDKPTKQTRDSARRAATAGGSLETQPWVLSTCQQLLRNVSPPTLCTATGHVAGKASLDVESQDVGVRVGAGPAPTPSSPGPSCSWSVLPDTQPGVWSVMCVAAGIPTSQHRIGLLPCKSDQPIGGYQWPALRTGWAQAMVWEGRRGPSFQRPPSGLCVFRTGIPAHLLQENSYLDLKHIWACVRGNNWYWPAGSKIAG